MHNDEMTAVLDLKEGSWGIKLIDESMSLREQGTSTSLDLHNGL